MAWWAYREDDGDITQQILSEMRDICGVDYQLFFDELNGDYTKIKDNIEIHIDHLLEYCYEPSTDDKIPLIRKQTLVWVLLTSGAVMSKHVKKRCEEAIKKDLYSIKDKLRRDYRNQKIHQLEKYKLEKYTKDLISSDIPEYSFHITSEKVSKHEKILLEEWLPEDED